VHALQGHDIQTHLSGILFCWTNRSFEEPRSAHAIVSLAGAVGRERALLSTTAALDLKE
jgi:hypothetical protein